MTPHNRLTKPTLLTATVLLVCSCDKLPFLKDDDSSKKSSSGEQAKPPGQSSVEKKTTRPSVASEGAKGADGEGRKIRPLQKGEYILYRSSQPLPAGTGFLTTIKEVKKRQMTLSSGDKKSEQKGNTTIRDKVYGGFVDSDHQLTIRVNKDLTTEENPPKPTREIENPLHEEVVMISKEQGVWKPRVKVGMANKSQKSALADFADEYNYPSDLIVYGTKPRKVGDRWQVNASRLPSLLKPGYHIQPVSKYKAHFKEIKKHQSYDYALLEMDIDLHIFITDPSVKSIRNAGEIKSKMSIKGKMITYRFLNYGISLAEQLNLMISVDEIVMSSDDYGVKKYTMSVQQNTTTELELSKESKSKDGK